MNWCWLLTAMAGTWLANATQAQVVNPDFFNRGGVALYNPEIGVVESGAASVVRPLVSADRKYVTIATTPQLAQVVRIENFPVARWVGGWVGRVRPASVSQGNSAASTPRGINASWPLQIYRAKGQVVLNQSGTTWIAPP